MIMPCQCPCRFYTTQGAGVSLLTLRIGDRIWEAPGAPPLATPRSADRQQVASADGAVALLLDTTARNHWVAAHSIGLAAFLIAELLGAATPAGAGAEDAAGRASSQGAGGTGPRGCRGWSKWCRWGRWAWGLRRHQMI